MSESHVETNVAWRKVWESREALSTSAPGLRELLLANGYDTAHGRITESSWISYVERILNWMRVEAGSSVFEVGCGAGAMLHVLEGMGFQVGGLDFSAKLISTARLALSSAELHVADASELEEVVTAKSWDVVLANGVFLYFPSDEYACRVIGSMERVARRTVGIFDVADASLREDALSSRVAAAGSQAEYEKKYRGLDHYYMSREWTREAMQTAGLSDITCVDQHIDGYDNARFRFNIWGQVIAERGEG